MNYQDRKGLGGGRAVTLISMNDWFRMSVWTMVLPFTIRRLKDILTKITVFCHEAARLSHFSLSCHRHLSKKNRCQTDTDSWHIPVPATFQEDIGNSGEIKWGDYWTSKGALAGKMSYCSSFNLLITIHCLQHIARGLHRLSGGGISKIVFWSQDFVFCIWYLVTSLCMDKVEQGRRVQRD